MLFSYQYKFNCKLCLILFLILLFSAPVNGDDQSDTIVLTQEDIQAVQALKMADILNNVPGVKAGDTSVSIHGSYKVKVYVDGRPINDPASAHGGVKWDMVSPDDVVRIEILRGKGGLAYGQDASGGVILVTTRKVSKLSGYVKTYGGNHDSKNANGAVSTALGKFSVGINGGYETTDGYKVNNDKERYQAGFKLGFTPTLNNDFTFTADYLEDERGLSGQPAYPTPFSRKKTRNTSFALQGNLSDVKSSTYYNTGWNHNTDVSRGLDKILDAGSFGQDITTVFRTLKDNDLNCGLGFTWEHADGTGFDDQEEHSVSLFAAQTFSLPKYNLNFTAGLRGSTHSEFDDAINPEIKLVYKQPAWRITAAYSRTQNTPSFYQRYNETSSTIPNPDLDMEQADNYSLSLFAKSKKGVAVSVSGFYNLLTDRITYVTTGGIGQYQNFGDVLYAGGDMSFSWKMCSSFKTKGAYTYLRVKDRETDLWVPGKAEHVANLTLYWQPLGRLSVVTVGKYSSKVYRNKSNTTSVPSYTIADMRVEYGIKKVSLFGEVTNFFDKTYYYADGLLAKPRTWLAGINWRF